MCSVGSAWQVTAGLRLTYIGCVGRGVSNSEVCVCACVCVYIRTFLSVLVWSAADTMTGGVWAELAGLQDLELC